MEKALAGERVAADEARSLLAILTEVGLERIPLEAPCSDDPRVARDFHWLCTRLCGPGVNLGNVDRQPIALLEQMQRGLYW